MRHEHEKLTSPQVLWPTTTAVSPGVKCGNLIAVSGQVGGVIGGDYPEDVQEQARLAIEKVKAILEAGGASLGDVVMCHNYIARMEDFDLVNEVYVRYFGDFETPPARMTAVVGFADPKILFEITAMAVI